MLSIGESSADSNLSPSPPPLSPHASPVTHVVHVPCKKKKKKKKARFFWLGTLRNAAHIRRRRVFATVLLLVPGGGEERLYCWRVTTLAADRRHTGQSVIQSVRRSFFSPPINDFCHTPSRLYYLRHHTRFILKLQGYIIKDATNRLSDEIDCNCSRRR